MGQQETAGRDNSSPPRAENHARRLRILRISTDTYPDVMGGGALHAHLMSKVQSEMGHDVSLVTSDHGVTSRPRKEERAGYDVFRQRELFAPLGNSITKNTFRSIASMAREHDIIHAHSHLYYTTNVAALVSRVTDAPFVITNHGLFSQSAPKRSQELFLRTVGRLTFNCADQVFCYTPVDRERLRRRGVTSSISVVPNGVDTRRFVPGETETGNRQILYVGRLLESKGVGRAFEVFERLSDDYPDVSLKIVGDGPMRSRLERRTADENLRNRVTFTGAISNRDVVEAYQESTLFVLPSRNEGFPRTILEAMSCELPVVVSDLPQLRSAIDGAGVAVPTSDITRFKEEIERLLVDEGLRESMGRKGREIVKVHHSWRKTVSKTTEKYYDLIDL